MATYLVTFDIPVTMAVKAASGEEAAEKAKQDMADVVFLTLEDAIPDDSAWALGFYDDDPEWEQIED